MLSLNQNCNQKATAAIIRLLEGQKKERKKFLSLEKKNYLNKVITSLNVSGKIISNTKEILTAEHDYFLDLYTDRTDSSDES